MASIHPDVDGCFEVTLASRLRLGTTEHLQIQHAISQYRLRSYRLSPKERLELATALYWEFCGRLCRVRHDEQCLQILQEQYNQIRDFVAPIYRLPLEILAEIISIDLEGRQSPIRLMLVCQHWCKVVESMASKWESLKVGTWTSPARVERSLKRAWWLNVVIHTNEDAERRQSGDGAYIALALAAASASRWKQLTIESLPREEVAHPVPSFACLSPMRELNYLKIDSQAESSPLLTQLLENIGSAAVGSFSTMKTTSLYTIQLLLRPSYVQSLHFLTTLHIAVRKTGDSVDLLPHLSRLEVLHITNVSLPSYGDHLNLPLTSSLRQLCLKAVSVQWMGGRIFPKLQSCAITSPPHYPPLLSDIDFPICTDLEFQNWKVRVAGQFRTPMIHSLAIKSNEWTPVRGSKQLILLCSVGLGFQMQPRVLHLATLCNECVLVSILELLPALVELRVDIERPCALGRRFFTSLLAKPTNEPKSDIHREWEALPIGMETRKSAICPLLKRLELKYERWLRQTEQLDILPPLMAMSWSRESTATQLESFRICIKDSNAQWKVLEPKGLDLSNGILDLPQIRPYLRSRLLDDYPFFKSCVIATATSVIHHDTNIGPMREFQNLLPLFGFYFRHLYILRVDLSNDQFPNFEILPNFFRLEELDLSSVSIPSHPIQIDLPFVRTLRRLSLRSTSLTWMDGRVFPRLERFYLCNDRPVHFPKTASLPVCTHIKYIGEDYRLLQSAFLVPTLIVFQHDLWSCRGEVPSSESMSNSARPHGKAPADDENTHNDEVITPAIREIEFLKQGNIKTSKDKVKAPYTILLVGGIRVGKSSVVAFIANVLLGKRTNHYNFDILDPANEHGDSNDHSKTTGARLYEFTSTNGIVVRILDTPGFVETGNVQQDEFHKKGITNQIRKENDSVTAVLFIVNSSVPHNNWMNNALSALSDIFPSALANNIGFMFTNVWNPLSSNFNEDTVPSVLKDAPQFEINNPFALQQNYLKYKNDPRRRHEEEKMLEEVKFGEQKALGMLVDLFDWLDGLQSQQITAGQT